jgi:threonine/homoserine/homoserine lactone efflux protein
LADDHDLPTLETVIPLDRLLAFALTALVVIVIPGPSVLFVVGRALGSGRVLSVLGNAIGEYIQVIAVAFGVGAIAEQSVAAFTALKLIGGLYLVYLGVKTFRARRSFASAIALPTNPGSDMRSFGQGLTVGATNPKTVVFLAAILPQFVDRAAGDAAGQILVLGLVFAAIAILSDSMWVLAAGTVRTWFAESPRRLEMIGGFGGLAIAAVGGGLLLTGRRR